MHRGVGCNPDNVFDIAIYMALKRKRGEEKSRCICRHLRIVHKKEKPISWRHFIASSIHEHRKLRRFPPSFFFFLFLSASQNVKMQCRKITHAYANKGKMVGIRKRKGLREAFPLIYGSDIETVKISKRVKGGKRRKKNWTLFIFYSDTNREMKMIYILISVLHINCIVKSIFLLLQWKTMKTEFKQWNYQSHIVL